MAIGHRLAGHYALSEVMEVGSELSLKADERFKSMLAYGALDELASGCAQTRTERLIKF